MTTGIMRKATVYAGLLAMTVGMVSVQAPEGRAQGGIDREMVYVPARNISKMPLGWYNRLVNVSMSDFLIGKTEVTGALWQEVYDWAVTKGYVFANQGTNRGTMLPVTKVSWYDVVVWTNAYSEKDGLVPVYRDKSGNVLKDARVRTAIDSGVQSNNNGYQLPNPMQSEMVARWLGTIAPTTGSLAKQRIATTGKDKKTYYWTPGNYASGATENTSNAQETQAVAWYNSNSGSIAKVVGGKRANALGLYDVNGNVWEWQFTWTGWMPRGIRGGGWYDIENYVQVSYNTSTDPRFIYGSIGFRLARTALHP